MHGRKLSFRPEGELPIMASARRPRPKGESFSGFRYMKGVGISLVEVNIRIEESVIWV